MALAALIIAILAFLMASANLIVYLSKNVFSSHTIQYVSAESLVGGNNAKPKDLMEDFEEFDMRSPIDAALEKKV